MKRNVNTETIIGRVYEHDLTIKKVQNQASKNFGTEFISGSVSIATDEMGLNVLTTHYTYVTETTSKGTASPTYANLKRIMEGKTWVADGKDSATKVKLTPAAALNDFYPQGGDQLVSQQRNEGGFVNILSELESDGPNRRKFTFDVLITNVEHVEVDNGEDYARLKCYIFNFRNAILPFTLVARDPNAIKYFEGQEISPKEPFYTQVWGEIVCTTVKVTKEIESAFGGPTVDVSERQQREWVITGANPVPYEFDTDETITKAELEKAIADRNVYLEEVKTRAKEYYATKGTSAPKTATSTPSAIPTGDFNFNRKF